MSLYFIEQISDWKIMKVMEDEGGNHIWGFDIGKGSLGEAVLDGSEFKHVASLLLDADFGEIVIYLKRFEEGLTGLNWA